jgi:pimeloyl-ACP methyl ester carboxylesterase
MFFAGVPLPPEAKEFFDICSRSFVYRQGFPPNTPDEELSKLSMPVLYLASARDQCFNAKKYAAHFSRLVPHADIRIIEDKGHVLVNTASEVLRFLW